MVVQTPYCAPDLGPICEYIKSLRIEVENGIKKLVINSYSEFKVEAIVPGEITEDFQEGIGLVLKLNLFSGVPADLDAQAFFEERCNDSWRYENWIQADRIPKTIIYENVQPSVGITPMDVSAGDEIGTADQIKLSIEYGDSLPDDPRFMHPREFFSLLFWREDYDPIFAKDESIISAIESSDYSLIDFSNDPSSPYSHPLVQKMMVTKEDGTPGTFEDNDWLGLRPPLRTYKRVEWEARREHRVHYPNWQNEGSLQGLFQNPMIRDNLGSENNPDYYEGESKCNILVGEMAFRSGFKVFVIPDRQGKKLKYLGELIVKPCNDSSCDGDNIYSKRDASFRFMGEQPLQLPFNGKMYKINKPYGKKRYVTDDNEDGINSEISNNGKVIIYARKTFCFAQNRADEYYPSMNEECREGFQKKGFHVMILSEIFNVKDNQIESKVIDQHCDQHCNQNGIPRRCNIDYCGCKGVDGRAFIELIPGGDPTEEWGILDLNCLEEVQQNA